jgi:hypothetical protein
MIYAREVDRLTKELGLAKVCEGPDTDIDAIRQAVDFAAEVDSGALPPSVRCWLLQDFDANSPLLHAELISYIESMSELQRTLLSMTKIAKLDVVGFWGCQTIYEVPFTSVAARLDEHCIPQTTYLCSSTGYAHGMSAPRQRCLRCHAWFLATR